MNIKPLALAVSMLTAATATAGDLYESDNNKLELSGWAKAVSIYVDADVGDKEPHVFTDAHIKFTGTHTLNEQAKVVGSFAINAGDSAGNKNAEFSDIKLELDHSVYGNFSFGDTGNSFGAALKGGQGEGSNLYAVSQGGVDGQGLRYKKTFNDFEFSANYETDSDSENESNYATSFGYKTDKLNLAVAFGSDGEDANSVGVGGKLEIDDLTFGASFVSFENAASLKASDSVELTLDSPNDGETYAIAAAYKVGDFKFYTSYQLAEGELQGIGFDAETVYLGLNYEVTSDFKTDFVIQQGTIECDDQEKQDGHAIKFVAKYTF